MIEVIRRRTSGLSFMVIAVVVALAAAGCDSGGEAPAADPGKPAPSSTAVDPMVATALAAADASDGTTDKVVGKCVMCAFAMDGSADHAAKLGEYSVHLCSAKCREAFAADPSKAILAAKPPAK